MRLLPGMTGPTGTGGTGGGMFDSLINNAVQQRKLPPQGGTFNPAELGQLMQPAGLSGRNARSRVTAAQNAVGGQGPAQPPMPGAETITKPPATLINPPRPVAQPAVMPPPSPAPTPPPPVMQPRPPVAGAPTGAAGPGAVAQTPMDPAKLMAALGAGTDNSVQPPSPVAPAAPRAISRDSMIMQALLSQLMNPATINPVRR